MRIVRHKPDSGHVLFRYPYFSELNDCDERVICLSERSMAIILNALEYSDQMRTRVYSSAIEDNYTLVGDTEWSNFQYWVSTVRTELGGYLVCNEFLERIAIANETMAAKLTSLDEKAEQAISLNEFIDDIAAVMGVAHPFLLLAQAFRDLFPNLSNVKMNLGTWLSTIYRSRTFEMPMLAALAGMNTSLGGMAAAQVGEKTMGIIRTIAETFGGLNAYYTGVREALLGDFNMLDFLQSLIGMFIGDDEGGEGGEDPDNDPELRAQVNIAQNIETTVLLNCDSCGLSHSGGCCTGPSSGTPITEITEPGPVSEGDPEIDPPPSGGSWEEYRDDKCIRIKAFLENFLGTVSNWGTWSGFIGAITVAMVQFSILVFVSPLSAVAIATALGSLALSGSTIWSHFNTVVTYFRDHFDEIVCELKDANSTDGMIGIMSSWVELAVLDLGLDPGPSGLIESSIDYLLSHGSMAFIIEDTTVPEEWAEYECPCEDSEGVIWSINILICTPTVTEGEFNDAEATTVESCEGNYFGTTRSGINCGSQPDEEVEREVYIDTVTGGGSFYVTSREGGIDVSNPMTAAELEGSTFTCSQLQACRLDASDTDPFTITFIVSVL